MQISQVRISLNYDKYLKGFADIVFDEVFVVKGIKIINQDDHYLIAMPSRKRNDGTFQDVVHPTKPDLRKQIEKSVLEAYFVELSQYHSN